MNSNEIKNFLDAAGVDECLAIFTTKDGKTQVVDTTKSPTTQAGMMYQLKKLVDTRLVQNVMDADRRIERRLELKKSLAETEAELLKSEHSEEHRQTLKLLADELRAELRKQTKGNEP